MTYVRYAYRRGDVWYVLAALWGILIVVGAVMAANAFLGGGPAPPAAAPVGAPAVLPCVVPFTVGPGGGVACDVAFMGNMGRES